MALPGKPLGGVTQRHLSAMVTCCLAEMDEAVCLPGMTGM